MADPLGSPTAISYGAGGRPKVGATVKPRVTEPGQGAQALGSAQVLRIGVIGQGFMGRAHSFAWSQAARLGASPLEPRLSVLCGQDEAAAGQERRSVRF